jgi:hypothetical protein
MVCFLLRHYRMDARNEWAAPLPVIFALLVLVSLLVSVPVLP